MLLQQPSIDRVTSVTDPLSHATTFTYNNANLVLTATNDLSQTTTYTHDNNGNVLTVTDANSNVTTYTYDDKDQLQTITDAESGVWDFNYDEVGNLVSKTNPRGKTTTYTYDDLGRLVEESDPLSQERTYAYDAAGRLTARVNAELDQIEYTYNDRNELTRIDYPDLSFVSFAYNDAGARTQMVDGTGTTTYAYDDLCRLTSVTFPGSTTATGAPLAVSFTYDGEDTRVGKTVASTPTAYLWDRESGLPLLADDGSKAYLHAGGALGEISASTREDLIGDALGSVRGVSDGTGALAGSADFDAYGGTRASTGSTAAFAFTGEQSDPETGLTYLRARYLDPSIGRFGAVDTVIPNAPGTQGFNPYAYVANNPSTWVDPTGHTIVDIGAQNADRAKRAGALAFLGVRLRGVFEKITCYLNPWCRSVATTIGKSNLPNQSNPPTKQPGTQPPVKPPWWHPLKLPLQRGACVTMDVAPNVLEFLISMRQQGKQPPKGDDLPFKASTAMSNQLGELFVGPERVAIYEGYDQSGSSVGWATADGATSYRTPEMKGSPRNRVQANFQWRKNGTGRHMNVHMNVDEKCP